MTEVTKFRSSFVKHDEISASHFPILQPIGLEKQGSVEVLTDCDMPGSSVGYTSEFEHWVRVVSEKTGMSTLRF